MAPISARVLASVALLSSTAAGNVAGQAHARELRGNTKPLVASALAREHMARQSLSQVLEVELGKGHQSLSDVHLQALEDKLEPLYKAMPKNKRGLLGHATVRYALHRHFVQNHGMYVNGLDPGSKAWDESSPLDFMEDRVPAYVQRLFERRLEDGFDLHELALIAGTLEHFVSLENSARLREVFVALGHSGDINKNFTKRELEVVTETYMASYVEGAEIATITSEDLLKEHTEALPDWEDTLAFIREVEVSVLGSKHLAITKPGAKVATFRDAEDIVRAIQERFGEHQDHECQMMAKLLLAEEMGHTGRVKLSSFYRAGWQFHESQEYLKELGALDMRQESPEPLVVISNYVMSSTNCMPTSSIYSVCCIDTCETILRQLEEKVQAPTASTDQLLDLVAHLGTDTTHAPRQLSATLKSRLGEIAAHHGGDVPLHGRLFAQWLHHAYPRECPYPVKSGVRPISAADWLDNDQDKVLHVSSEEVSEYLAAVEQLSVKDLADGDMEETMPWSAEEELVYSNSSPSLAHEIGVLFRAVAGIGALFGAAYGLAQSATVAATAPPKEGKAFV